MKNYVVTVDSYPLSVKSLKNGIMTMENSSGDEFIAEFIITDKQIKITSLKRSNGGAVFSIWYYISKKLERAIRDGETF